MDFSELKKAAEGIIEERQDQANAMKYVLSAISVLLNKNIITEEEIIKEQKNLDKIKNKMEMKKK